MILRLSSRLRAAAARFMREPPERSRGRFVLPFFLGLAASSESSTGAEIEVPTDSPTIAQAIQSASPGDTISILPGEYDEVLTIAKDLTLRGAGGDSTVVKTALQSSELLHVEGAAVIIEDLRFAGGFAASQGIVAAAAPPSRCDAPRSSASSSPPSTSPGEA